ncbi:MAG: glycosyltransferase family 4 protein [Mariniphaga sp.]
MKILFILHIPPPIHGAAMVGQAIKESREINTAFDGRYINLSLSDRVDTIGKNGFAKVWRYISLLGQVIRQFITFKPDLCYLTIQIYRIGFYKDLPMVILAKLFGVKVVYHLHNKGVSKWQHRFIDNLLYRMVFKNAEVILLSKNLYPDIQKYVPEERVHICANGVGAKDNSQWSMVNEKRKGRKGERESKTVEILFLSNLIESKGVLVLLEACPLLKNKGLGFHCTFVGGEGDISEQLLHSKIEQLNIQHYVTYAGLKYSEEKEQLLADADIFVLPTYNDCFPLVLLEAMQHALPIVSTFEGAISEMVINDVTGFLVPQKEAKPLADKLEILITNSDLRDRMGAAGRARYEQNYTLEIFEKRMKEILNLF